jgi:energy-coupling factor transporter transmembrane protein EcfT
MTDSMIKSFAMLGIWILSFGSPEAFFQIMTSIIAFVYFGAMLKLNVNIFFVLGGIIFLGIITFWIF